MPVRKITNTGTQKNTGLVPSYKNERPIAYESLLERDCIYLFEFNDSVLSYSEQPFKINYNIGKKSCIYTPDFQVNYKNGTVVIYEVKPQSKWDKIKESPDKYIKYLAASKYCVANGFEFRVLIDTEIRSGYVLKNIKYLYGYSRIEVPASIKMNLNNVLCLKSNMRISDLIILLSEQNNDSKQNYRYILSLLYSKYVKTDLDTPISMSSLIYK